MKQYQHLVKEERFYIWQALREGKSQQEVAVALGRHPSTISREVRRNKYPQCHMYTYHWAMELWQQRKRWGLENKHRKLTPEIEQKIEINGLRPFNITLFIAFNNPVNSSVILPKKNTNLLHGTFT